VHLARVFAHGPEKRFSVFRSDHVNPGCRRISFACTAGMIPKSGFRFSERIVSKQKSVQQQSGDWTMTGKVPVARIEGQELLTATLEG
jgi:hypothetical protein